MAKSISHTVTRPGMRDGDPDIEIPVAEDLTSVPGVPQKPVDVAFYSREYPLETQSIDKSADRQWAWASQPGDITEVRNVQEKRMEPMYEGVHNLRRHRTHGDPSAGRRPHRRYSQLGARDGIRRGWLHEIRPALHFHQQETLV